MGIAADECRMQYDLLSYPDFFEFCISDKEYRTALHSLGKLSQELQRQFLQPSSLLLPDC